jgi:predicted secreted protein
MFSKSMISNNILAVIPISKNNTTNIYTDKCSDFIEKKREYFGPVKIQKLKIQLLNQYGDLFDLNNMDFSFSVDLEMGYDW